MFSCYLAMLLAFTVAFANRAEGEVIDDDYKERISNLEQTLNVLARQMMMQQFYVEESARSSRNSGLKRVRNTRHGPESYMSGTHADASEMNMHNHANYDRVIGMGEAVVVLNGIETHTRHNDYRLVMKSKSNSSFDATEDVPFPEIPPSVAALSDIPAQIAEMKEYFKAFANQNKTLRDYRPYFKPVLCYLEGAWTISDQNTLDESFASDRHHIDATSWKNLQDKVRFTAYSGAKDQLENFAYLPTTIYDFINDTIPLLAQWNYRILCHPLKKDLPFNRLVPVEDLASRMSKNLKFDKYVSSSRLARFQISPVDDKEWEKSIYEYSYLDDLMYEVPGYDSYGAKIRDNLFGDEVYEYDRSSNKLLNAAQYHRVYRSASNDANGRDTRRRGFGDENLFVALTTREKIPSLKFEKCNKKGKNCVSWTQRWSYAVPLEIIYLTPLSKWNPYEIPYKGDCTTELGKSVFMSPKSPTYRIGGNNLDRAYNGTNSKVFYFTPLEFFEGEFDNDPADTTKDYRTFLDPKDPTNLVKLRASGVRIFFPNMPGIGAVRQRYPIIPFSDEGDSTRKELDALKNLVLFPEQNEKFHPNQA